jgi:hypothetical protein
MTPQAAKTAVCVLASFALAGCIVVIVLQTVRAHQETGTCSNSDVSTTAAARATALQALGKVPKHKIMHSHSHSHSHSQHTPKHTQALVARLQKLLHKYNSNTPSHARVETATWCPFACAQVIVASNTSDASGTRDAVMDALLRSGEFERAGTTPYALRPVNAPAGFLYGPDALVHVLAKNIHTNVDDPSPSIIGNARRRAAVQTAPRRRALRALNNLHAMFGMPANTVHYVTPKKTQ